MEYIVEEELLRETYLLKIINFLRGIVLQADQEMHLELLFKLQESI